MHPPIDQSITWIYTEDLADSAAFYRDRLGLVQVMDQGGCVIFRMGISGFLGVCRVRPGRFVEPKGVVITFVTSDVDEWHRHVIAAGLMPDGPPMVMPEANIRCFFLRDPNGYMLEFQTFLDPAWSGG